MAVQVLFFARLREDLGAASLAVPYSEQTRTVTSLLALLSEQGGTKWAEILADENILYAVNQEVVEAEAAIADGDEVAFYPPVTGG